jgi:hypothetical protein
MKRIIIKPALVLSAALLAGCAGAPPMPSADSGSSASWDGSGSTWIDGGAAAWGDARRDSVDPEKFTKDSAAPTLDGSTSPSGTTWDPNAMQKDIVLSSDRLTAESPAEIDSVNNSVRATVGKLGGKWYWEVTVVTLGNGTYHGVGFGTESAGLELGPQYSPGGCGYVFQWSHIQCNDSYSTQTAVVKPAQGDRIGVALDLDKKLAYFSHNGGWQAGANPAAGSGGQTFTIPPGTKGIYPMVNLSRGDAMRANFGATPFAHPAPKGFQPGW